MSALLLPSIQDMLREDDIPTNSRRAEGSSILQKIRSEEDQDDDDEDLRMLELQLFPTKLQESQGQRRKIRITKTRSKRSMHVMTLDPVTMERRQATPQDSMWWKLYVEHPDLQSTKFNRNFRRRFRLPYSEFVQLVKDAKDGAWFPRWMKKNCKAPLELLILSALRYLGRGWTFDDLEENTMISVEVHRNFFHQFVSVGEKILYPMYVKGQQPATEQDAANHGFEYDLAGFTGGIGSSDATHITIEKCSYR